MLRKFLRQPIYDSNSSPEVWEVLFLVVIAVLVIGTLVGGSCR